MKNNWLKYISFIIVIALLSFAGAWYYRNSNYGFENSKAEWRQLTDAQLLEKLKTEGFPNFISKDITNSKFVFSELKGKKIILNFWASWCDPCIAEFPSLIQKLKNSKDEIVLVAISQDDSMDALNNFLKAFPEKSQKNIYIIWDHDHEISRMFHIFKLPESFIINSQNKMVTKILGATDWLSPENDIYFK